MQEAVKRYRRRNATRTGTIRIAAREMNAPGDLVLFGDDNRQLVVVRVCGGRAPKLGIVLRDDARAAGRAPARHGGDTRRA